MDKGLYYDAKDDPSGLDRPRGEWSGHDTRGEFDEEDYTKNADPSRFDTNASDDIKLWYDDLDG